MVANSLPLSVEGVKSPYPTVVKVTTLLIVFIYTYPHIESIFIAIIIYTKFPLYTHLKYSESLTHQCSKRKLNPNTPTKRYVKNINKHSFHVIT